MAWIILEESPSLEVREVKFTGWGCAHAPAILEAVSNNKKKVLLNVFEINANMSIISDGIA
jgi:hypothetical protein